MGFGSFLSNGLTAATNSVGAYQGAMQKEKQSQVMEALQQIAMQRQQSKDALDARVAGSTIAKNTGQAAAANAAAGKTGEGIYDPSRGGFVQPTGFTPVPGITDKPTPAKRTPVNDYTDLKGGPVQQDESGDYYDANGQKLVGGQIKRYVAPKEPTPHLLTGEKTLPDGTKVPTYGEYNASTHTVTPINDSAMTPKTAAGGSQTSAQAAIAMQRLGMSLADVEAAHARMTKMENDPAFRAKLTVANQAIGNAADVKPDIHASGLMGALNNAGGSMVAGMAQKHLAENDPELNTYRRDKETVGTALTEVLPRPNQQLLQIEKGLSGIDAGWNPALTAAAQSRRANGVTQLKQALSALQAGRGGAQSVPSTPHVTASERAALKAQGYTDAQIDAYKP